MTKEEILFSFPQGESEPYGHVPINRIYEAMDRFAQSEILSFCKFMKEYKERERDMLREHNMKYGMITFKGATDQQILEKYNKSKL